MLAKMDAMELIEQAANVEQPLHLSDIGLGSDVREIINALADTYQCSKDMIITTAFVIVGVAAGKNVIVNDGKYTNKLALYYAPVARSGSNKSFPLKVLLSPLKQRNASNYLEYKQALDIWKSQKDNPEPKPFWQQIIMNNCTTEARYQTLANTDYGVLIYSDELKTFLDNLQRYSKNGDVSELLSMYDGDDVTINRKSEESVLIKSPFLSIMGSIQPSVLSTTFGSSLLMGNGFNQRWLFTFQENDIDSPYSEQTIDAAYKMQWCAIIDKILDSNKRTLQIEGAAKRVYIEYFNQCQKRMNDADDYVRAVLAKLEIIVERIAACIHLLNGYSTDNISADTMQYAVSLMPYYERSALKVYEILKGGQSQNLSKKELIKQIFENWSVSQNALAKALGVSQPYINKCLNK